MPLQQQRTQGIDPALHRSASANILEPMVGKEFDGIVSRADDQATWVRLEEPPVMGKWHGNKLEEGTHLRVKLDKVNVE